MAEKRKLKLNGTEFRRKVILILLVLGGVFSPSYGVFSHNALERSMILSKNKLEYNHLQDNRDDSVSYLISYRNRSGILEFELNKESLAGIDHLIKIQRRKVLLGKGHFSIVSYIRPCDLYIPQQLNAASIQASVVRAYLKSRHHIKHDNVTFAFDTIRNVKNQVRISYVESEVQAEDNQEIFYVLSHNLRDIVQTVGRYSSIPLIDADNVAFNDVKAKASIEEQEKNEIRENEGYATNCKGDRIVVVEVLKPTYRKRVYPTFSVKSNLLSWVGVMPKVDYRYVTPNLELEYYMGNRWSINVDGSFTYIEKNNETNEIWATASLGMEPRFWFNSNGRYRGLYAGAYGSIAQFDVKVDKMSIEGYTGDVNEGGVSLGYYLPFSARWGIELGARYGYRSINYDSYEYRSANGREFFYYQSSYVKNGLQLTGVRFLVSYRLGKSIIYKKENK